MQLGFADAAKQAQRAPSTARMVHPPILLRTPFWLKTPLNLRRLLGSTQPVVLMTPPLTLMAPLPYQALANLLLRHRRKGKSGQIRQLISVLTRSRSSSAEPAHQSALRGLMKAYNLDPPILPPNTRTTLASRQQTF